MINTLCIANTQPDILQQQQSPHGSDHHLIPVNVHGIDVAKISSGCLNTIAQLQQHGYTAYLVGGAVRDLLLDRVPKDFDVATSATPEQVRLVFRRCRLIGRRFRLAHVYAGAEIIEVATFRGNGDSDTHSEQQHLVEDGRILRDNVFGSEQEDAIRRDFTANALFYDPKTQHVIDYVDGYTDLKAQRLRLIGDAETRYREDPVRMLRAVRFASSRDLTLVGDTESCILPLTSLLSQVPPARLFDEICKLLLTGDAYQTTSNLVKYGLFKQLFPNIKLVLDKQNKLSEPAILIQALNNSDTRVRNQQPVTPGFLFAVLLWSPLQERIDQLVSQGYDAYQALSEASEHLLNEQSQRIALPRRFGAMTREIWMMQQRFTRMRGKRAARLLDEARFRAAYDFLLLHCIEKPELQSVADWWTQLQTLTPEEQMDKIGLPPSAAAAMLENRALRAQRYHSRPRKKRSRRR